jgi:hypothetical protein
MTSVTRLLAVGLVFCGAAFAHAADPVTVTGGGVAELTDPDENTYTYAFGLAANRNPQGNVSGHFHAAFQNAFANAWGAVPGVDVILISGTVTSITLGPGGAVVVEGRLTEFDFSLGDGLVFSEEDVPFRIDLGGDLGRGEFLLQWCELPTFPSRVLAGSLAVR